MSGKKPRGMSGVGVGKTLGGPVQGMYKLGEGLGGWVQFASECRKTSGLVSMVRVEEG